MLSARKEGFIIRKSRIIGQQKQNQQRRHMSQTQFYRKSTPVSRRTPGLIVHMHHKNNNHMFNSDLHRLSNDDLQLNQSNPQYDNSNKIKYEYQQNQSELKQKGEQANIVLNDNSFEEINTNDQIPNRPFMKIQQNIKLAKILQKMQHQLQNRTYSVQVLQCVKLYVQFVEKHQLGDMNRISTTLIRRKILKESLTFQRYGILLIGVAQVLDGYQMFKSYLMNIVSFSLDNLLLRLAILTEGKDKAVIQLLKQQKKQKLLNRGFETVKNNNEMINESITKVSKIDSAFYDAFKKLMKLNKTLDVKTQFAAVQQFIAYFLCQANRNQVAPFLSIAPAPYLPTQEFEKYTLVVDILECLCTRNRKVIQAFRPFAQYFLDQMSQYFQIVSFSDAMPSEASKVISLLDRKKHIKHRLFKHHLNKAKGTNGKDLTRLGRDMSKVILIDTNKSAEDLNTITVNQWKGKRNDAQLAQLCPILAMIAIKKLNPQKAIKRLQQKNEQNMKLGFKHINCGINLE